MAKNADNRPFSPINEDDYAIGIQAGTGFEVGLINEIKQGNRIKVTSEAGAPPQEAIITNTDLGEELELIPWVD